jgi:hypothetical protein
MKVVFCVLLCFFCAANSPMVQAQTRAFHGVTSRGVTLNGVLKLKQWSKSTESYCVQGSEYYVLSRPNQPDLVLQMSSTPEEQWLNQRVRIRGERVTKSIPKPDDGLQHPVSSLGEESFQCTIFRVKQVNKIRR